MWTSVLTFRVISAYFISFWPLVSCWVHVDCPVSSCIIFVCNLTGTDEFSRYLCFNNHFYMWTLISHPCSAYSYTYSGRELLRISGTGRSYGLDIINVTQWRVSKHWRCHKTLAATFILSSFHWPLDGRAIDIWPSTSPDEFPVIWYVSFTSGWKMDNVVYSGGWSTASVLKMFCRRCCIGRQNRSHQWCHRQTQHSYKYLPYHLGQDLAQHLVPCRHLRGLCHPPWYVQSMHVLYTMSHCHLFVHIVHVATFGILGMLDVHCFV